MPAAYKLKAEKRPPEIPEIPIIPEMPIRRRGVQPNARSMERLRKLRELRKCIAQSLRQSKAAVSLV
jgi:hypothetical protein